MIKKVATSEIGMSINGRMAISQSRKNRKMTSTTRMNEITSVSSTSAKDLRMFLVLSINTFNWISDLDPLSICSIRL